MYQKSIFSKIVPRFGRFILDVKASTTGNPFRDYWVRGSFRQGEHLFIAEGFYNGEQTYTIRFMPLFEGEWNFSITSNCPEMDGITGHFLCQGIKGHGPITVYDTFAFTHFDGTPYYPVGTTAYGWSSQKESLLQETLQSLQNTPFNKIRMSPLPKHYLHSLNEPDLFPFEGGRNADFQEIAAPFTGRDGKGYTFDFSRPNITYWRKFDHLVECLEQMEIQCDLIFFHFYDRWGFSTMTVEDRVAYIRYVCARYGAYAHIWWSLANEWDLLRWPESEWEVCAKTLVDADPYHHLCSIHNGISLYDPARPWITHLSLQLSPYGIQDTEKLREKYQKPVVWDEIGYEGDIEEFFGDLPPERLVHRAWSAVIRGGYFSHGETYQHPYDEIFWAKGGKLVGRSIPRIAFLRRVLENAPGVPVPQKGVYYGHGGCLLAGHRILEETNGDDFPHPDFGSWMLFYLGYCQPAVRTFTLPHNTQYCLQLLDTWEMTATALSGTYSGTFKISLPSKPYLALLCTEIQSS